MDTIENIGKSSVQHGKHNDRIYVMKLYPNDLPRLLSWMEDIMEQQDYSKIFAKVPSWGKDSFLKEGYKIEAKVPNMLMGKETIYFMAKYYKNWRKEDGNTELKKVLHSALEKQKEERSLLLLPRFTYRVLNKQDVNEMVEVYKEVFETYPFPIHNPEYLIETMEDNFVYFGVFSDGDLVAVSSCEMDEKGLNVEMTDFATLPDFRGFGLAGFLLGEMEKEMKNKGIKTAFTIARAQSFGMNITFAKKDYEYTGTLIKNTNIAGNFESMNVWYKSLD
jgi:putative beta-lysine N-acetyltransferase